MSCNSPGRDTARLSELSVSKLRSEGKSNPYMPPDQFGAYVAWPGTCIIFSKGKSSR